MRLHEIATPKPFPGLTPEFRRKLQRIRRECRVDNGGGGACHLVSEYLEHFYGWQRVSGCYTSSDYKEPLCSGHYWNLLPDGSILDATADQFGEGDNIRLIKPDSPLYHRYRPEFYSDFGPDSENYEEYLKMSFPHLDRSKIHYNGDDFDWEHRIEKERGRHWAVTHPKQFARYWKQWGVK